MLIRVRLEVGQARGEISRSRERSQEKEVGLSLSARERATATATKEVEEMTQDETFIDYFKQVSGQSEIPGRWRTMCDGFVVIHFMVGGRLYTLSYRADNNITHCRLDKGIERGGPLVGGRINAEYTLRHFYYDVMKKIISDSFHFPQEGKG